MSNDISVSMSNDISVIIQALINQISQVKNPYGEIPMGPGLSLDKMASVVIEKPKLSLAVPLDKENIASLVSKKLEEIKRSTARLRNFFGILNKVNKNDFAVFGGAVRDWTLSKSPKDIDIVLDCDKKIIDLLTANFDHKKSQFDGYQFHVDGVNLDIWRLQDSWIFRQKFCEPSWGNLVKTVPFNIDGILVLGTGEVFEHQFFDGLNRQEIELVCRFNKSPAINITQRALRFQRKYDFSIGPKLEEEMKKHQVLDLNKLRDMKMQSSGGSSN